MQAILFIIDINTIPNWIILIIILVILISFFAFLYLGLSGKRDVKLLIFEIKNKGFNISTVNKQEFNKINGNWDIEGKDIQIPAHPFAIKYCYEANVRIEINKYEIELLGHLTYRNYYSNEKIFDTKSKGIGYIADGHGSISYQSYSELNKQNSTTGLGMLYVKFNLNGKEAKGYFLTSCHSDFGMSLGTISMVRI